MYHDNVKLSFKSFMSALLAVTDVKRSEQRPMKTRTGKFLLITLLCLAAAGGQNALAGTIAVTSTADDGPGSLRQALVLASNGDTINIVAKGTITLTSGELIVDKSLTIRGPGAAKLSVNGNAASRVFHVTPNTVVTISGLKITNGSAIGAFPANAGGGIYSDHAQLTVSNCTLNGNSARFGAGIFSNSKDGGSATLTVNNTTLSSNSGQYGGGIFSGGGFFNTGPSGSASLTLNNSTLGNNSALYYGGGILNDGFSGTATLAVNNSALNNNPAGYYGGGIFNNGDSGVATATLTDSTVSGNSANLGGGGIYNDGTSTISLGSATLALNNSTVNNNSARDGGGIVNSGLPGSAALTLNNSTVNNNSGGFGGGISSHNSTLTLDNSTVSENSAYFFGGGIFNDNAIATLNNSTVNNNSAERGGGIENYGSATLTLNKSTVNNNSAADGGGGISNFCDRSGGSATATLTDSTVSNNSGSLGGGIYNYGQFGGSVIFTVNNSTVSGSSPVTIYTSGVGDGSGLLVLRNSTVSNNANLPGVFLSAIQNISINDGSATVEITNTILNAAVPGVNIGSNGSVISHGYNLSSDSAGGLLNGPGDIINTNPMLGPLKNNGGPTKTHALLLNSPAIDAGDPNFDPYAFDPPLLYDQRNGPGFLRVVNGRIDIGAFESRHP